MFFYKIKDKVQPVELKFTSAWRVARMALLCLLALFLPVLLALLINGFNFNQLELGGSAVWFCIAVPVVPVYLLKFGIAELHDRPWIYTISETGKKKRYKERPDKKEIRTFLKIFFKGLFVPPVCFAVWFAIICFFVMVYLTAFGFD